MKLYIAEKPSLGRAIVAALPKPHHREKGFYRLGSGDVVTWCVGHLLDQAEPEDYDPAHKQWRMENLPIIPEKWQVVQRSRTRDQLKLIRQFLKEADEVIHAGDPDREGQLLVDEVLHFLDNRLPVQRLLINDLNVVAVKKALNKLQDNHDFRHLSTSALARSRADWLYGMNMTRAYTLLGQRAGYDSGVLSVGRVQTPVLGLVVKRDEEIENFTPQVYFDLTATFTGTDNETLRSDALWLPGPDTESLDEEGRVHNRAICEAVAQAVDGQPAQVVDRIDKEESEPAPLPYNLSSLQIDCANIFGYSAREVLDICQTLYEKHQLITYPRSDCRYLPEDHFEQANDVLDAMVATDDSLLELVRQADSWQKNRAWNNKKVTAHHAIVPTLRHGDSGALSEEELSVYGLIARRYLAQFYTDHRFTRTSVFFEVAGERFVVKGKHIDHPGWKLVLLQEDEDKAEQLAPWKLSDRALCTNALVREKKTRPPQRFTDATLMAAMTGIARFVDDPEIKRTLRETDGLGTEATRAMIIDLLFKRGYLLKGRKTIMSTQIGRDLIHALPEMAARPDMTALWESTLAQMAEGEYPYNRFIHDLEHQVRDLIDQARAQKMVVITTADDVLGLNKTEKHNCPTCSAVMVQRKGKNGKFWGCSRYPECRTTVPDKNGKPDFNARDGGAKKQRKQAQQVGKNCPECHRPLVKRKGKRGVFAGCSGYPECTYTEPLLQDREID